MEKLNKCRFGWQFFQIKNIINNSEALVKEDNSLKGVVFSIALAFLILIASAQFLVMLEQYLKTPANISASAIEQNIPESEDNVAEDIPTNKTPLLVKILGIKTAHAQSDLYEAKKIIQSHGSIILPPGQAMTFQVGFKNTGNTVWSNKGPHYISIYNRNKYKDSFRHKFWLGSEQPAKLQNSPIHPGEIGYFRFALQSPDIPGNYIAKFQLAAENLTWIEGGELQISFISSSTPAPQNKNLKKTTEKISENIPEKNINKDTEKEKTIPITKNESENINKKKTAEKKCDINISSDGSTCGSEQQTAEEFSAFKLIQSHSSPLTMQAGSSLQFRVGFKNSGTTAWTKNNISLNTSPATFLQETVAPGALGYFIFTLQAPTSSKQLHLELTNDKGQRVPGGDLDLAIQINGSDNFNNTAPTVNTLTIISKGPSIRVGLFSTEEPVQITANLPFSIQDKGGSILKNYSAGEITTLDFQNGIYLYDGKATSSYLKIMAENDNTIFEILTLDERPKWNPSINYNQFRGNLELRQGERRGKIWMINELSLEDYVKGIAETSNYGPMEYLKTMAVAARSYAHYHYTYPTKHAEDFFTVDDTYDQVYRGYASEKMMPNFVQAVNETNGKIVTYNGEIVVTPYFSTSDGRTRAWTEVWGGGAKPWLVSVPTPHDAGKTLWGHGVGLAATNAVGQARDGENYQNILKYYYTGTDIQKIY